MTDRYLFRGKRVDNGEWVEGFLSKSRGENKQLELCIDYEEKGVMCSSVVIPETVGQCTGLKDKNGKLIFEGDILNGFQYPFMSEGEHNYYAVVVWFCNCPAFGISTVKNPAAKVRGISNGDTDFMSDWASDDWEVIGNTTDNPELSEVENEKI